MSMELNWGVRRVQDKAPVTPLAPSLSPLHLLNADLKLRLQTAVSWRFPVGLLSNYLGQLSLPSLRGR